MRRNVSPPRYDSSSSTRSTPARPFRTVVRDLGLTPNQGWGLTKTDGEWSRALEIALMATRRDDLEHGTNAAYVAGCVCIECREHQRVRMAKPQLAQATRSVIASLTSITLAFNTVPGDGVSANCSFSNSA
jgi:hypothetical protein